MGGQQRGRMFLKQEHMLETNKATSYWSIFGKSCVDNCFQLIKVSTSFCHCSHHGKTREGWGQSA